MMRLTLTNQKGGIGKTTISTNLARMAADRGLRVLFIDLDVQANASFALKDFVLSGITSFDLISRDFSADEVKDINLVQERAITVLSADPRLADGADLNINEAVATCDHNIELLKEHYDLAIIDTAPTLSNIMMIAFFISRQILVPIEPEAFSLLGLQTLLTTINNARRIAPYINIMGLVVNKVSYNKPRHLRELNNLRQNLGNSVLKSVIGNRDSVAEAQQLQCALGDLKKKGAKKAAAEFSALCDEVLVNMRNDE